MAPSFNSNSPALVMASFQSEARALTKTVSSLKISANFTKASVAAVMKKYDVSTVFGTKENEGAFFGRKVPALLVYKDSNFGYPQEVYPRNEKGSIITIEEYLSSL
mgnify:CR=1 FL=1